MEQEARFVDLSYSQRFCTYTYRERAVSRSCLLCWLFFSLPSSRSLASSSSSRSHHIPLVKTFFNDRALVSASSFFPSSSSAHLNVVFDSCNFSLDDTLAVMLGQAADWLVHYYPGGGVY